MTREFNVILLSFPGLFIEDMSKTLVWNLFMFTLNKNGFRCTLLHVTAKDLCILWGLKVFPNCYKFLVLFVYVVISLYILIYLYLMFEQAVAVQI